VLYASLFWVASLIVLMFLINKPCKIIICFVSMFLMGKLQVRPKESMYRKIML